jgi:dienelactone hydrolase
MTAEKVHTFGDRKGLLGVVAAPDTPRPGAPAVVILNAGLVHRVGPFRMAVELSRRLARAGLIVLRFDQSALGDSLQRKGGLSYEERAVVDAREAMDFLAERYEARRFIVIGLCSGAMNAHRVALADERVTGAILLDGYAYRTKGYMRQMFVPHLVDSKAWRSLGRKIRAKLEKHLDRRGARVDAAADDAGEPPSERPGDDAVDIFAQDWPPLETVRRELATVLARGARFLFVYTGGWSDYVFADQFYEMFPELTGESRVRVEFLGEADHTYMLREHREAMMAYVTRFVETFGG